MNLKWDEIGDTILINRKLFYRLLRRIQKSRDLKNMTIKIISHTGNISR